MSGGPTLSTETAEVTTAAVEIKTLTVRGKQVTLAVFRQLEEKRLISDDGHLNGLAWGRVNYHPDKCGDEAAHMHVVWQDGADLRRARVATEPWFRDFSPSEYVSIRYALELLGAENEFWRKKFDEWGRNCGYGKATTFTVTEFPAVPILVFVGQPAENLRAMPDGDRCRRHVDDLSSLLALDPAEYQAQRQNQIAARKLAEPDELWRLPYPGKPLDERIDRARSNCASEIDKAHEAARAIHDFLFGAGRPSVEEARESLLAAVSAEDARRKRITSITATLAALPQLFIAV